MNTLKEKAVLIFSILLLGCGLFWWFDHSKGEQDNTRNLVLSPTVKTLETQEKQLSSSSNKAIEGDKPQKELAKASTPEVKEENTAPFTDPQDVIKNLVEFSKQRDYIKALELMNDTATVRYEVNPELVKKVIDEVSLSGRTEKVEIIKVSKVQEGYIKIDAALWVGKAKFNKQFDLLYKTDKAKWEVVGLVR